MSRLKILKNVLDANDTVAAAIRADLSRRGLPCLNFISSPGAGKTALLERLIADLTGELRFGVVEGDVATANDAERIARAGAPVVQVNTEAYGGDCHLNAGVVRAALDELPLDEVDLVVIENVGNLICPCSFDLGEDAKVLLLSVAEGADKPLKYPLSFRSAGAIAITKTDAAPFLGEEPERYAENARAAAPGVPIFQLSAKSGDGVAAFAGWLRALVAAKRTA